MCFYGFLCSGEITVPSRTSYKGADLSKGDVAIDDPGKTIIVQIKIRVSKSDPFHHGVMVYVWKNGNKLCPVAAITAFLWNPGTTSGLFFLCEELPPPPHTHTQPHFFKQVCLILSRAGYNHKFMHVSFRISAASTAAACGIKDSNIQT